MNKFRITIASLPDREELVAEVIYDHYHWAEISAEIPNNFVVQFYKHPEKDYWEFPYEEAIEILQEAKERLVKLQRTPEQQAEYDAWVKKYENWKPTPEETAEYERKMEEQRKKYYE